MEKQAVRDILQLEIDLFALDAEPECVVEYVSAKLGKAVDDPVIQKMGDWRIREWRRREIHES